MIDHATLKMVIKTKFPGLIVLAMRVQEGLRPEAHLVARVRKDRQLIVCEYQLELMAAAERVSYGTTAREVQDGYWRELVTGGNKPLSRDHLDHAIAHIRSFTADRSNRLAPT